MKMLMMKMCQKDWSFLQQKTKLMKKVIIRIKYFLMKPILLLVLISTNLYACRLWGIISLSDYIIPNSEDSLQIVQSESEFFEQLGIGYDSWSIAYYNQSHQIGGIHRSDIPANIDTMYQEFFNQILDPENDAKLMLGHLRSSSSGASDIPNPHPFFFDYNNKTYSLIHNGTISKTILISLLTDDNTDSTWINNNPPNTFNDEPWYSDEGWANVIDSELFLYWIMKNIQLSNGSDLESIMYSLQMLEAYQPSADKNIIFSDGDIIYAYGSEGDGSPDLYYSDLTPIYIEYGDSTITPHFVSIMSQIPLYGTANHLNWTAFNNETLMVIDNDAEYTILENFINHSPQFPLSQLVDTLGIGYNYNYELIASDSDGDTLVYFMENNPDWVAINNGQLIIEPQEEGIFSFSVIVSDGELSDNLECIITVGGYQPTILSILDVPNDDGGWVYIEFIKSFWDMDNTRDTEIYHIERLTSGEWISVGSSAAYNSDTYTVQVPTEQDSTDENDGMTTFRVIASMEEGVWISLPDSGYSINNNNLENTIDSYAPDDFSLFQNYPNPFNSNTLIRYSLPEKSNVTLVVYNLSGTQVIELINESQDFGNKEISWDGRNDFSVSVSTGIYFYQLKCENYIETKKMIFSK